MGLASSVVSEAPADPQEGSGFLYESRFFQEGQKVFRRRQAAARVGVFLLLQPQVLSRPGGKGRGRKMVAADAVVFGLRRRAPEEFRVLAQQSHISGEGTSAQERAFVVAVVVEPVVADLICRELEEDGFFGRREGVRVFEAEDAVVRVVGDRVCPSPARHSRPEARFPRPKEPRRLDPFVGTVRLSLCITWFLRSISQRLILVDSKVGVGEVFSPELQAPVKRRRPVAGIFRVWRDADEVVVENRLFNDQPAARVRSRVAESVCFPSLHPETRASQSRQAPMYMPESLNPDA